MPDNLEEANWSIRAVEDFSAQLPDFGSFVNALSEDIEPSDVEHEYINGYRVAEYEPEFHEYYGWIIRGTHIEEYVWSTQFAIPFITREHIVDNLYSVRWNNDYTVPSHLEYIGYIGYRDESPFPSARYTDYTLDEPFEFENRWYVVMRELSSGYVYRPGQTYYSSREGCDFRLRGRVRSDLFNSENAFMIQWSEEESEPDYEINDGYSVERDEIDIREIAPVLSTNIGRDIPLISIEQEFSGNGEAVAGALHSAGYAYAPYPDAYHMSEARHNQETDRICYVETDSSCGYELIFSKINLKNRLEAEKISHCQNILRELKNNEHIRLSARCGFHVHVDVSNWGMKEIVSAYHLWNYLEDTIFRFASAFWGSHRDEEVGGGYSTPVPKGHTGRAEIANRLTERRDALNFSHILRSKTNCRCGAAMYEDWANCVCNLPQPTLEFRVFNATMNQRKIKAYLAFCVAFVNMAKKIEHNPVVFEEMRWRGTNVKEISINTGQTWEERTLERIKYILNEFLLTGSEKSDIMYCFRNCSLEPVLELL